MPDEITKKVREICSALSHAFSYVQKDGFKNLASTKELDKFVLLQTDEASRVGPDAFLVKMFKSVARLFKGYDAFEPDTKKSAINEALSILAEIEKYFDSPKTYASTAGQDFAKAHADYEDSLKNLATPVRFIPGVGPKIAAILGKMGINTVRDLLFHLPFRYEDLRKISTISKLSVGETAVFTAKIIDFGTVRYGRRSTFEVVAADDTGSITLKWFKATKYIKERFKRGDEVIIAGIVKRYNLARELHHPEVKKLTVMSDGAADERTDKIAGIKPVYSETEGLNQYIIKKIIAGALNNFLKYYSSPLDTGLSKKLGMVSGIEAIRNLHLPEKTEDIDRLNSFKTKYHERIIFDEFFYFELLLAQRKKGRVLKKGIGFSHIPDCIEKLKKIIPFKLTSAQENVVKEITGDMQSTKPMNRLLQGDVGSGKTIVALFSLYIAAKNSYQAAIMAPTEILASQHYKSLAPFFDKLGISSALLTGSLKKKEREAILEKIRSGETQVIIGTHAVIQDSVQMNRLGLAIIDEQHRFGVMQRTTLIKKAKNSEHNDPEALPDVLIMTATPIPRTLAITVYGDLDVSIIDEMPPGRKPVRTKVFYENQRDKVYEEIRRELKTGNQAYIVYPLVTESEKLDLMDATNMAQHLSRDIFPDDRVGLLHGKVKPKEKAEIMRKFKARELDILVATTVIEVGIDIPTASIMVVEHAERFGLSQLHQLRGRVGRGNVAAKCILLAQYSRSEESQMRLKVMETTTDGFMIAEEDLKIRGPGELLGTRQSGLPDFQVASLIRDLPILKTARKEAFKLIHADPKLEKGINRIIKKELIERMRGKLELYAIG